MHKIVWYDVRKTIDKVKAIMSNTVSSRFLENFQESYGMARDEKVVLL